MSCPNAPKQRFGRILLTGHLLCIGICLSTIPPCSARPPDASATTPVHMYTSIAPLAFIVASIGGLHVTVEAFLQAGQDPHIFEPNPREFYNLSRADVYLMSGLPFEYSLVDKIKGQNTKIAIVDITQKITFLAPEPYQEDPAHAAAHEPGSASAGRDPHFWLGTKQLRQYINAVTDVMSEIDPHHAAVYRHNTARLLARLDTVHAHNVEILAPYRNRVFFSYHPAFNYFAATYGLRQQTVETQGHQPGPRTISTLIQQARAAGVHTVFVQPQYDNKCAQTIASAINGRLVPLDPLAYDVIQNLEHMACMVADSFTHAPDTR